MGNYDNKVFLRTHYNTHEQIIILENSIKTGFPVLYTALDQGIAKIYPLNSDQVCQIYSNHPDKIRITILPPGSYQLGAIMCNEGIFHNIGLQAIQVNPADADKVLRTSGLKMADKAATKNTKISGPERYKVWQETAKIIQSEQKIRDHSLLAKAVLAYLKETRPQYVIQRDGSFYAESYIKRNMFPETV